MGTPYRECPNCGAHLDAGEPCDCTHKERDPRPEAEPEKPLQRMRLMVVCREVDKETGKIAVYPLKMEIDDHVMQCLQIRARANPELRYFALVSARWERYGDVIAGILKRRSVTRADVDNIGGIVELCSGVRYGLSLAPAGVRATLEGAVQRNAATRAKVLDLAFRLDVSTVCS